ncbi:MAG: ABC transporter permease [Acidobacteria bacterium]|nr:ABC transporter permease [Acidobacteriota bacterium]
MKKVLVIARREFLVTVTRKGYIFTVVGLPLFFLIPITIGYWTGSTAQRTSSPRGPIALIDRANVVDLSLAETLRSQAESPSDTHSDEEDSLQLVSYQDLDRALDDLKQGRISACYVIEADYMATGAVVVYTREGGLFANLSTPGRSQLHRLLRASLAKGRVAGQRLDRILEPSNLKEMRATERGQIKPARSEFEELAEFFGPFGMFLLLTMAIFLSSGYLLQGIAEEKQNRVIEVLLSSVKPTQLLAGKILGLGAAGLLQVAFYIAILILPATTFFTFLNLSAGKLLLSCVYFVLGYLLFASLMAGTGVIGNTVQESSQLSIIWTMTSMIPMFMLGALSGAPNSMLARGLSYFPLTAPVTMLLRISATKVPVGDVLISIGMLILGIYLAVKGAAKVFRAASLMYGKRPSLPEILRWLREA